LNQWQRHRFALLDVTIVIIAGAQEPIPCGWSAGAEDARLG
jgi:hypothetical protein